MSALSRSKLNIEFQWQCDRASDTPAEGDILRWANASIDHCAAGCELTIRVVDKNEIQQVNNDWRQVDKPTNVLSFPASFPSEIGISYLGDLLICADVLLEESRLQNKSLHAHWAHIVVHGMLHLQGYDHVDEQQAADMESREVEILASFGYNNPYELSLEYKQS